MSEITENITADERIGEQPIGADYPQDLLEFLDREFAKPEHPVKKLLGQFVPLFGLLKGLNMTRAAMIAPKFTVKYPEEKLTLPKIFRGKHVLLTGPNDDQLCICCNACATICPVNCIDLKFRQNDDPAIKKRILTEYNVDLTKCLFCGLCQEVCPEFCVILGQDYEYSDSSRGPGFLKVRMEDIRRRATDEEWTEIQNRKNAKKKPAAPKPPAKPGEESKEKKQEE